MIQSPILITGCGRSGSSMIAGAINICGAFCGNVGGENKHFENWKVHKEIIEPYLETIHADPTGQYPLPNVEQLNIPVDIAKRVVNIMRDEGYKNGPWMLKSSRLCLTWPLWHYAFPNAKWLIVRRRTGDIISSCIKTHFMNAFDVKSVQERVGVRNENEGWRWWVRQHEQRFVEMIDEGLNCQMIWPERMVWGDYQQMFDVVDWLGLEWNARTMNFIDPKLEKSRRNGHKLHNLSI